MPRFIKTFLFTGIPFGLFMSVFYALIIPWNTTLLMTTAPGSGIFFGLCMAAFVSSTRIKHSATPRISADEQILKASPANHFAGAIAMGGWLFLTNQRLIFQAHALLQERYELSVSLTDIMQAQPSMTAWIIPNGLTIRTRQGQIERFVVEHRRQWSDVLGTVCAERAHDNA